MKRFDTRLSALEAVAVAKHGMCIFYVDSEKPGVYWQAGNDFRECLHGEYGGPPLHVPTFTQADVDKAGLTHQVITVCYVKYDDLRRADMPRVNEWL